MIGFERHLDLFELLGNVAGRSLQGSAREVGDDLLPGRAGNVDARSSGLAD